MKRVLVLGAGLVSRPLVHYLTDQPDLEVDPRLAHREQGRGPGGRAGARDRAWPSTSRTRRPSRS